MANHLLITLTLSTLLIFSHFTLSKPTTTNEQEDDEEDLSFLEEPELSETSHSTEPDQDFPDFDPFAGDEDDDESFENYEDFEDFEVPEDYDQPQDDNVLTHFDDHDVVVLTEGNFSDVVEGNKYVMVEFYVPWCGHCKALAPEYAAAATATEMKGEGDEKEKVVLAKVDAQEESELAERYEVQGFPTVLWFVEGVHKPYLGPRTKEAILTWIKKKTGPAVYNVTSVEDAEKILASEDKLVLTYLDSLVGSESEELAAASRLDDVNFYQTVDAKVAKLFHIDSDVKLPALVLLKKDAEKVSHHDGPFEKSAIKEFVFANKLSLVTTFSKESATLIFESPIKKQVLLFATSKGSAKVIQTFEDSAKLFKGKDAEQFMNLQNNSAMAYILKANALILLEKFELARDVIRTGLQIDASSDALMKLERFTSNMFGKRSHGQTPRTDDFDCTVCLKLLYEPITTPCGHTFCRSCLFQSMDRGNRCPLCRTVLFISPRTCAISVTLKNIIEKNFPEEYAERKLENDSLTNMGPDLLPLFVMDVVLPCQKFHLNIFEARYRLMVRRIMEGNRRMGMVIPNSTTGSVAEYACEVEITDCEPLPDGRFFLEVESRRRCRILRNWDQDGYRVAEIEWIQDLSPAEGTKERSELKDMTETVAEYARSWIKAAQEAARGDQIRLTELHKAEGLMPSTRDLESFSFWLATLTNRRPRERLDLLRMRDTTARLRRAYHYMKAEE